MTIYLNRDYLTQTVGSAAATTNPSRGGIHGYMTAIFLRRVLGYSHIGSTNYNINTVSTSTLSLLIATADTTPAAATPSFPVGSKAGINFGGGFIYEVSVPPDFRAVSASDIGRILVLKSTANPKHNSGAFLITGRNIGNNTTITSGSNGVSLPTGIINVVSTTGFPGSGTIYVNTAASTTIAVGSNGLSLPQTTINVASTTGFPSSGTIYVTTSTGVQVVTYSSFTGTSFTSCTGGTGTMSTGNAVNNNFINNTASIVTYSSVTATSFNGCSGGSGIMSTGGSVTNLNRYIIDYRSADSPPIEATDSIQWYLYTADGNAPLISTSGTVPTPNSGIGYRGNGSTSAIARIILQSPHSTGWQVRICNESSLDASTLGQTCATITCAPGFGGDGYGDFAIGGDHLHTALYYNTADSTNYFGSTVGFGEPSGISAQYRITMIGDDTGQSVSLFFRRVGDVTAPNSCFVSFGIPDNEPLPLPLNDVSRLYVLGSTNGSNNGNYLNDIGFRGGNYQQAPLTGIASSIFKVPISCAVSLWNVVTGANQYTSPIFNAQAGDCPFTSSTELLPIEIMAGTIPSHAFGTSVFPFEPRLLGTIPFIKIGRANFGNFSLTTDVNKDWQHTRRGLFMMWNGPATTP